MTQESTSTVIKENINGHHVIFEPIEHTYYVDGVKVKSVSEICKLEHPFMYQGIDDSILKIAALRGTNLHKEIEEFELNGALSYSPEFTNYLNIKSKIGFKKELTETMVIIEHQGKVICAGRFDLLASIGNQTALIDFKRTSQVHLSYVTLQLNLYRIGLIQSYGKQIDQLLMIRLKNYESDIVKIPIDESYVNSVLKKHNNIG